LCTLEYSLTPEINLASTGFPYLDRELGGLRCGRTYLIEGRRGLLDYFVYQAMISNILHLEGKAVFVDCGNALDPYLMARMCRERGWDEKKVLKSILVSRPFTAYQLNTLIEDGLTSVLKGKPVMVVLSRLLELFTSGDVEENDAGIILRRALREIRSMVRDDYPLLITHAHGKRKNLPLLEDAIDSIITIRGLGKHRFRIKVEKDPVMEPRTLDFSLANGAQSTLENYMEVEEWEGPCQPIGTGWRGR
jgi:hypothetical protein